MGATSLTWTDLRPWKGDQRLAFEELCCQLAAHEPMLSGARFIRKGAPDAGVECYWILPDGTEHAWQAKFFPSRPDNSQWRQMDESVERALDKHPRLAVYTFCLPLDRQDPRIDGEQWFFDAWKERVEKWRRWASERGMEVEFGYWGEHEIFTRLTQEEHRGRHYFWFNRELFSDVWFERRLQEATADAGTRYTPELNVDLPIAKLFDGLGRTERFLDDFRSVQGRIRKALKDLLFSQESKSLGVDSGELRQSVTKVLEALGGLSAQGMGWLDLKGLAERSGAADSALQSYRRALETARKAQQEGEGEGGASRSGSEPYGASQLSRELRGVEALTESHEACLANTAALALLGKAGTGKTHLLCDIAEHRLAERRPTILLLGEKFNRGEPWSQILEVLGLDCTREEFLGALEAAAEARGAKALILLDALNEGEGKDLWHSHLAGMLTLCEQYPWLSVAVSVRSSYEDLIIPSSLLQSGRLVSAVHHGFSERESEAMARFFSAFGLKMPSVPPMLPELRNPLFLKLFCQGLKNRGLTEVPAGVHGITAVFGFYLSSVNEKLATRLDFDKQDQLVQRAAEAMAGRMADLGTRWLDRAEAKEIVDRFLPQRGYQASLFRNLMAEGILAEERIPVRDKERRDAIRFGYERFADHQISRFLLDRYVDPEDVPGSFAREGPLKALVADEFAGYRNQGLLEALCTQLPERYGVELPDVSPSTADSRPMRLSFVASLPWRAPGSFSKKTKEYINHNVVLYQDSRDALLNAFLIVAANPHHPYNADFLHRKLKEYDMPERDAWWSIFLHEQYGDKGPVDRLVEWAWSSSDKSHIDDESIRLTATVLCWFLTTSNRFLRDRATKALVALLMPRLHILRLLLRELLDVDDLYVVERVLAVAYGCALRSTDDAAVADLAGEVYRRVFKKGRPVVHVLARDYARGVIECAFNRGAQLKIPRSRIRSPFRSRWPKRIPSKKSLEKYGRWEEGMPDAELARFEIYHSVMGFGDFARYIIGTNSSRSRWSARHLGEEGPPPASIIYTRFIRSLTPRQSRLWDGYIDAKHQQAAANFRVLKDRVIPLLRKVRSIQVEHAEKDLRKSLRGRKRKDLDEYVIPFASGDIEDRRFDLEISQRWVLSRVFDLGWTVERFGMFDRDRVRGNYDRSPQKAERIGKKYQWIAWHEFLAMLSDHFEFLGDSSSRERDEQRYNGPWQIGARDIDPSLLVREVPSGRDPSERGRSWWSPAEYDLSMEEGTDLQWVVDGQRLPEAGALIEVVYPQDRSSWLVLETNASWEQVPPLEEDPDQRANRRLWYQIRSYIVRRENADQFFEWAVAQSFMGRWMPESIGLHEIFLGELFWAPAFQDFWLEASEEGTSTLGGNRVPCPVLVPACSYHWDEGFDGSIEGSVSMDCPAQWLIEQAQWRWNGVEGRYIDSSGRLVCTDPTLENPGPSALLVRRDAFLRALEEDDRDIVWTVLGEKQILPPGFGRDSTAWLEVNGAYRIRNGKLEGKVWSEVKKPGGRARKSRHPPEGAEAEL